jgi:hypothetical protein
MSSSRPTKAKSETLKKKIGHGFRGLFGKKAASRIPTSNSSQSLHSSEAGSVRKHGHKPSITIEETTLPVVEAASVAATSHPQGSLQAPIGQSRQSLTSQRSKGSFTSNRISANNEWVSERNWVETSLLIPYVRRQWEIAYEIALEKLSADEISQVDFDKKSSCSVYLVLDAANKARADRDENKWRYTKSNGEVIILRDKFDRIVEGFAKYAGFISATTQHQQPDATSLVWVTARSLIEVYRCHLSHFLGLVLIPLHCRSILTIRKA